jgi:ribosomal protein L14E/L6E/L27E
MGMENVYSGSTQESEEELKRLDAESLSATAGIYDTEAKALYNRLSEKYDMKDVLDPESQAYPLSVTEKIKKVITDEGDQEAYKKFAEELHLADRLQGARKELEASADGNLVELDKSQKSPLHEILSAQAKILFDELATKYDVQKVMNPVSQTYPLYATEEVRKIITDENDIPTYKKFAHTLHAADVVKKRTEGVVE